ncbi:DUF4115 domain-containing protein [Aliiglaciecola sp. CAU 1673]|uniref:RodZ domain-containing protein n=1 Tax=Aliiglaciecola sp. CAU 1673 TaxID=3032595 RepID=UPI0023DB864F|nr:RodZ domain-containing protein [Aliiglaciecola sp. CAU 1673]MDF2178933.1 DUF4115 domain-containing protein [Aliiglaciecola sp. CAU 1673]
MKSENQQQDADSVEVENHADNVETLNRADEVKAGPGYMLKSARIALGLSVEEVATKLNLRPGNVVNLEAEHFDERISVTFTRGYLKLYAKLVGLDSDKVLEAFEEMNASRQEPAKLQSFSRRVERETSDDRLMLVSYLILTIILALVVLWWWQQSDSSMPESGMVPLPVQQSVQIGTSEPETDQSAAPTEDLAPYEEVVDPQVSEDEQLRDEAALMQQADSSVPSADNPNQPALPLSESQNTQTETRQPEMQTQSATLPTATQPEQSAPTQASPVVRNQETQPASNTAREIELIFEFAGDCWINITDATGEAIAYGVKASGRIMPVTGLPPFEVVLGAPESVQISYNGRPVDMSVFKPGQTARFTLPMTQ